MSFEARCKSREVLKWWTPQKDYKGGDPVSSIEAGWIVVECLGEVGHGGDHSMSFAWAQRPNKK